MSLAFSLTMMKNASHTIDCPRVGIDLYKHTHVKGTRTESKRDTVALEDTDLYLLESKDLLTKVPGMWLHVTDYTVHEMGR